jgi:hypothetical protein
MLALLLCALSPLASADRPPEVGVVLNPLVAVDLASDRPKEDQLETWTWLQATVRKPGSTGWFLAIDAEHHTRYGEDLEATWEVRAGESGWTGYVGPAHLRAGHLVERWGKLDLLPVVDVLNPSDLRAGPLSTVQAARMPVPMARLQLGQGRVRTELVWLPFPSADRVDMVGGDWSVIRPGMLTGFVEEAASWEGGAGVVLADGVAALGEGLDSMDASTLRGLSSGIGRAGQPEATLLTGEAALRLELEGPGIDAALMGGALRSHTPATELAPELRAFLQAGQWPALDTLPELTAAMADPLTARWPRTWFAGTELSTTAGPLGLRAEGGWWSAAVLQTPWLGSALSPKISGGVGVDWVHGSSILLSLEGRYTRYTDAPDALVLMREQQVDIGGLARVSTLQDRLLFLAAGVYLPAHGEFLARPEVRFRATDRVQLGLGGVLIDGRQAPPRTLTEAMGYGAGPMACFAENDSVFAQLHWIQ